MSSTSVKRLRIAAIVFLAIVALYAVGTRYFAFSQPYHQDEYKWALAADPSYHMWDSIPHPFFAEAVYREVGAVVGYGNLRIVPILLSLATLVLLFYFVRRWFGSLAALASVAVYTLTTYALIGSAQIDIDGAFLPLLTLLSFAAYHSFRTQAGNKRQAVLLLALCIILGFCTKLSFILVPATFLIDYALSVPKIRTVLRTPKVLAGIAGMLVLGGVILFLLWNQIGFLRYVDNFLAIGGRDYFQVLVESVKACIYLSPLIPVGLLLGLRYRKDLALWYLFLGLNILFYYVVFDFTHRTFDRYLLFVVLPGSIIAGVALARLSVQYLSRRAKFFAWVGAAMAALIALSTYRLFAAAHEALPLIPKTAFVDAVRTFHWNIVLPLTGGSGPLGFYVPVDGIFFFFVIAALCAVPLLFSPFAKKAVPYALVSFVAVAVVANIFMTSEYLFGSFYGSSSTVVRSLMRSIDTASTTQTILTYNDTAAYELYSRDLYAGRFYPHDAYVEGNKQKLLAHTGNFLVVGMPPLNPDSVYGQFFAHCKTLASATSGLISGAYVSCNASARALLK